jgi:MFS family permease
VALVSAGLSVGSAAMAPLARWLISGYDWRFAMLVIGDIVWLIIIPTALLVRDPSGSRAGGTATADAGADLTVGQALRTPQFAALALAYFACCAAHSGPIFHMVTNAMDHGISAMAATTVLSLYLGTGRLAAFYAVAVVFGFAYGGVMPLYAILVREYFGERILGTAFGAVAFVSTLGMALGPWAGGWLYDTFGAYFWLFLGSFGIGLGAVAIALTFRPPRAMPVALRA